MKQSTKLVIIVIIALFILIFTGLAYLFKTKRSRRSRQGWIPIASFLFCMLVFWIEIRFLSQILEQLQSLLDMLSIGVHLPAVSKSIQWAVILNAGVLVANIIFKALVMLFLKVPLRNVEGPQYNEKFYEYDPEFNARFLKDEWVNIRRLFVAMFFMYVVYATAYFYRLLLYSSGKYMAGFFFPVVILLVIEEIIIYLGGYTREEYKTFIGGQDSSGYAINNYYRLRDIYETLFPGEILSAHTSCDFGNRQSALDYLESLSADEDEVDSIVADFFANDRTDEDRTVYDVDMIQVVRDLLHKNNVVIFNPFYRDLDPYLILPVVDALVSGKRVLLISARNSLKEDLSSWMEEMIRRYCKFESLWRVGDLKTSEVELEVGIVGFNELYDVRLIDENEEFFDSVGFVLLVEPSLVVNEGQMGFSVVADLIRENGMDPVYCILDRITDGLVDTMSHLLRDKIVHVAAAPVPRNIYTSMSWDGDGDYRRQSLFSKQTRFLGTGMELAAVAVKNQIPLVNWVGEKKAPLLDIKWIIGQYYTSLCRYMNLPVQQQSIYDKIHFIPGLWSMERTKNSFLIVEDEFCNIFSMQRTFISRGEDQTFVNVMGDNYLLRDYMRCNQTVFMTNPNAVPSVVADFARTQRNTILKLLFVMSYRQVSEGEIRKELELINYPSSDVLSSLTRLTKRYTFAKDGIFDITAVRNESDTTGIKTDYLYSVPMDKFSRYLSKTLKNAYFVVENEDKEAEFIDAKLFSQVGQMILPGQFISYDGKYYQAKYISLENGVVLRRASDQFDGRHYYRQNRLYHVDHIYDDAPVSRHRIMDIETTIVRADFSVITKGFLDMNSFNNLCDAREVVLPLQRTIDELKRSYRNKNIMMLHLPETSPGERFTFSMLLSEMFRTIYPNTWQYLAVTTVFPQDIDGMLRRTMYDLEGEVEEEYIYIFEDSDIDLGLLESIDKNLIRYLELLFDYIDWHFEKMREPAPKDPVIESVVLPEDHKVKRRSGIGRLLERIARIFRRGRKKEDEISAATFEENPKEEAVPEPDSMSEEPKTEEAAIRDEMESSEFPGNSQTDSESGEKEETLESAGYDGIDSGSYQEESDKTGSSEDGESADEIGDMDHTDIFTEEDDPVHDDYFDEHFEALGIGKREPTRYQKECYLKFHFDEIDDRLALDAVRRYLNARGLGSNDITKARKRDVLQDSLLYMENENRCDFCGMPLSGVSYEQLNDGRIRCNDCSASAINTVEEFRDLFLHTKVLMEGFFGIDYRVTINVETADARTIAKGAGCIFRPSTEFAARVLGYAQHYKGRYNLLVENGSPRLATIGTMVHEMTHIWQYLNWDDKDIVRRYGKDSNRELIYEGMAMWAEIQYLYLIGETYHARVNEAATEARDDVYGIGFRLYRQKYPISRDTSSITLSPFKAYPPL